MRDRLQGPSNPATGRMTRREALKALGLAGLGTALLSACGQQATAPAPPGDSKPLAGAAPAASKPVEAAKAAAVTPKDGGTFRLTAIDGGKQPDLFGLALYKPDGSLFHTTGPVDRSGDAQPVAIVGGSVVNTL